VAAYIDDVDVEQRVIRSIGAATSEATPMRFDVITLFPELFAAPLSHGVTRRAFESGKSTSGSGPARLRRRSAPACR
jgi:hypothetical protein